jgi:hypothetical protein
MSEKKRREKREEKREKREKEKERNRNVQIHLYIVQRRSRVQAHLVFLLSILLPLLPPSRLHFVQLSSCDEHSFLTLTKLFPLLLFSLLSQSNLGFGAAKIAAGWAASSSALLADGFHMLGDMTSDVVTLATLKFARRPRSEKHPYGHGRFETVGTLFVSLLLSATGVGIAYHTIESLVPAALSVS